jgi:methionyl-tRNA formyltransferase
MRIGILTSVETRHRYFARAIGRHFALVAVGYERTGYNPAQVLPSDLTPEELSIVRSHFAERSRQEEIFFGHEGEFLPDDGRISVRRLEPGTLNSSRTLDWLVAAKVDAVLVYGTNLIREPLLSPFSGRMFNLHLGLSPYYRGTATNFYPLLNEEPEYVGATIHLIDSGIDSGPILRHARPDITALDRPHTIGCKAILAGIRAMIAVLGDVRDGRCEAVPQWPVAHPRLYRRRDYHPRQVVELYRKIEAGLIRDYVARAARTAPQVRLLE